MAAWTDHWYDWEGGRLHYLASEWAGGEDRLLPIVFLHGGAADSARRSWGQAPDFLSRRRLLALDFPGFGESELQSERVDVPFLLEAVSAFADGLLLKQFDLVGFSTGGLIAAHLALEQPERVRRLVLVAAAGLAPGIPFRPLSNLVAACPWIHRVGYRCASLNMHLLRYGMRRLVHDPKKLPPGFLEETRRLLGRPGSGAAWRRFLMAELEGNRFRHQVAGALAAIRVPTLLLHGRYDRLVPAAHSLQASRQIPENQLRIFDNCGHWIHCEEAPEFYNQLAGFLL